MSAPACRHNGDDQFVDAELARWPGVTWTREVRGKHYALVLRLRGQSRFVIYAATPSDRRGLDNHLRDARVTLKAMGAKRLTEARSPAPRRRRNITTPARVDLGERAQHDPSRDPFSSLAALRREMVSNVPFVLPIRMGKGTR